jgi:hypothetical protein
MIISASVSFNNTKETNKKKKKKKYYVMNKYSVFWILMAMLLKLLSWRCNQKTGFTNALNELKCSFSF